MLGHDLCDFGSSITYLDSELRAGLGGPAGVQLSRAVIGQASDPLRTLSVCWQAGPGPVIPAAPLEVVSSSSSWTW